MPDSQSAARRAAQWSPLLVAGATCAAFLPALWGSFQFDDLPNLVRDPATQGGQALLERLGWGVRPLSRLAYFFQWALWGMRPAGFLAVNLALHAANALAVYFLALRRATQPAALVCGLAFALQPANAEVVAYVSAQPTAWMALFVLLAMLSYEGAQGAAGGKRRALLAACTLCFALACLFKETALAFPLLLLVWEATRERGGIAVPSSRGSRFAFAGFACLGGLLLAGALLTLSRYRELAVYSLQLRGPLHSLRQNAAALPMNASLWLRPWALSVEHTFDPSPLAAAALSFALLAAVAVGFALRRKLPALALGLLWPVAALLPTHSFIARVDALSERALYLAWVGPALALGAAFAAPSARWKAWALAALLLGSSGILCFRRAALWSEPVALWTEAVTKAPSSARAWNNLGASHLAKGNRREAVVAFRRALRLNPADLTARRMLSHLEQICGRDCEDT